MKAVVEIEPKIMEFGGTVLEETKEINTMRLTLIDIDPNIMRILKAMLYGACVFIKKTGPKELVIQTEGDCAFKVTVEGV